MKKLLSIAAAALLTLALTSCGESDSSAKKVRIGVSIPAADHGWTGGVVWYAEKAKRDLEKSDPNLEITVSTARDAAEQVSKIENLLVRKIDALVVLPQEPGPLTAICEQARKQGVYLVTVDRGLDKEVQNLNVAGDNAGFGRAAAQALAGALKGKGDIVVMEGIPCVVNSDRVNAFREEIGDRLVVSIVAGATIASLEKLTGTKRIVRVMPNTPALVGEGMSCIAATSAVQESDLAEVETLLSSVGLCRRVAEKQLDAVTGLSGSGPAFVLEFIMALADGGVYAGLSRDAALELAIQTVLGSAKLARESGTPVGELRDAVISPAGTTSRGVMELAKGAFSATVVSAVVAAADRSAELGAIAAKS